MNNPFRRVSSRIAYESRTYRVREDRIIRPSGAEGLFAVVEMKHGACVLPVTPENDVYLIREFKYAIDRPSVEVVSGGIDEGESPHQAAARELKEEAGLAATEWIPLGSVDPYTTQVNGPCYLYLARGLSHVEKAPEDGEVLELLKVPLDAAMQMMLRGEITHAPSCALLYRARDWLRQGDHPSSNCYP